MRTLIIGSFVLVAWLGFGAYWHTCQIRCLCGDDSAIIQAPPVETLSSREESDISIGGNRPSSEEALPSRPWNIVDQTGNTLLNFPATARFKQGSSELNFDKGAEGFPDSVYNYLLANPEHFAEITGYVSGAESQDSLDGRLAQERAQALKDLLVSRGVNADRITIVAGGSGQQAEENGDLLTGLEVRLMEMSEEMEVEVDKKIAQKILYCEFNEIEFKPDPKLVEYASELKSYLERHPGEVAYVTGHTDHVGPSGANMWVGKKRARTVGEYFTSQGVPKSRLKIRSRGEHDPVADNTTEEGQALNRRIEVVIK